VKCDELTGISHQFRMSTSNTDTGGKPADPYKTVNLEDVPLEEKIRDLVSFVDNCKFCMMATRIASSGLIVSRCMALAGKEHNDVDMIFHANYESGKTDDLKSDPDINLGFLNSVGEWASISGKAEVVLDRHEVKKFYSPSLRAWMGDLGDGKHDGGPEDPRICLIKVKTITAQYSVSRKGIVGSAVEYAKGIYKGEPPQINKLRQLDESEIKHCEFSILYTMLMFNHFSGREKAPEKK
jgi:general stress protein 26